MIVLRGPVDDLEESGHEAEATSELQSGVKVLLGPLAQVFDLALCNSIREFVCSLLECFICQLKAVKQKFRMVIWRRHETFCRRTSLGRQ